MNDRIDFQRIADAALGSAEQLLGEWLPQGWRDGHEWKSVNPMRGDNSAGSFSININSGAWGDFATTDKGGDLVSLCAYLFHSDDQLDAAYDLADRFGIDMPPRKGVRHDRQAAPVSPLAAPASETIPVKTRKSLWSPVIPVPAEAIAPPVAHIKRGKPDQVWCYRSAEGLALGYIWRFTTSDGGKEVLPLTWCRHDETGKQDWRGLSFPDPRPLYGLDRLAAKPEATVLIVEGEKCADAAHEAFPDLAVATWPGGGKAVDKADWSPLAGRRVVIWPDCDAQTDKHTLAILPEEKQPGWRAARRVAEILHGHGCKIWLVRIPAPGEKPSGWDVADAVAEGQTGEALAAWVREQSRLYVAANDSPPDSKSISTAEDADAGGGRFASDWKDGLLYTQKGDLNACVLNVHDILLNTRSWEGVIAFDEFAQRMVKLKPPPYFGGKIGEWENEDDTRTAMWLSRHWRFSPPTPMVAEAVETLSKSNTIHPVRDWLKSRPAHDGTMRAETWLSDYCGVKDSPYVRLVSKFFLVGMIARVMQPGVKFDYCLVLEGDQGKGKSTMVRVLGGEWHGDTDLDLSNKDSMSALRGKWVYEFAEMGAVTRSESTKQKSFLSRQFDEFRPVYGRREIRLARQVVFIGTTNEWEWNKDPTGGRRFWPVDCSGEFNLEGLRDAREQLFAEALMMFDRGDRFWPIASEQKALFDPEQLLREQQESLVDALHDWVWAQVADFSIADSVMEGLKLDASKLTRDLQTRVGMALRKLGCAKVEKRNGMVRYWYKPPVRNGATSMTPTSPPTSPSAPLSPSAPRPPEGKHAPF
jgi:putative DNA primase/helicase